MATICCSVSSSFSLNVPSARLSEEPRGTRAKKSLSPVFSSEAVIAQKNLRAVSDLECQRSSVSRFRGRKRTVYVKAFQQESTSELSSPVPEYTPGPLDDILFRVFRKRMAEEVGWDSKKPGYEGLIEIVKHRYTKSPSKEATEASTVRVLTSLFPAWLLPLFRQLIAPLADGKVAAVMTGAERIVVFDRFSLTWDAFVTQATCQWLMGPCTVNEVTLDDGSTLLSGVYVHKCKYLEESKCAGICTHTCKIPTQTFIKEGMAIPLAMEPNFNDFSCQFKYGVAAPPRDQDPGLQTPCLSICPTAAARSSLRSYVQTEQCPQV